MDNISWRGDNMLLNLAARKVLSPLKEKKKKENSVDTSISKEIDKLLKILKSNNNELHLSFAKPYISPTSLSCFIKIRGIIRKYPSKNQKSENFNVIKQNVTRDIFDNLEDAINWILNGNCDDVDAYTPLEARILPSNDIVDRIEKAMNTGSMNQDLLITEKNELINLYGKKQKFDEQFEKAIQDINEVNKKTNSQEG
jgi:hypothetical protein